ncbi:septal ring lytic transglycosylase RlpA family protein [Actinomadura syzygii]|uniref:Probable endolytic peptidoglycan transglycosylase RlpA n=1 Tax=Actinomadura syzygii TaxID=1427538 RepID=A0A5D0UDQ0_9ACTN|nr:septal ring lytic transglycosylase RlpA family protein [Actinomadura syzygii]TYC15229.1 septal ring lytic transglycosylase RlpA family protein [Actinomadura syzygii]
MGSPVRRLLRARLRAVLIVSGAAAAVLAVGAFVLVKTDRPANSAAAAQAVPPTSLGDEPRAEPSRASRGGPRSPEPEPSSSSPAPKKTKPAKSEPDSTAAELAAPKKKQQYKVVRSGTCQASYYWEGQMTASGESFDPSELTAAHKTLPMGTKVRVTNKNNGRSVIVRINDRGPYAGGRCLDLSKAAMQKVGGTGSGVIPVRYQVLSRD